MSIDVNLRELFKPKVPTRLIIGQYTGEKQLGTNPNYFQGYEEFPVLSTNQYVVGVVTVHPGDYKTIISCADLFNPDERKIRVGTTFGTFEPDLIDRDVDNVGKRNDGYELVEIVENKIDQYKRNMEVCSDLLFAYQRAINTIARSDLTNSSAIWNDLPKGRELTILDDTLAEAIRIQAFEQAHVLTQVKNAYTDNVPKRVAPSVTAHSSN